MNNVLPPPHGSPSDFVDLLQVSSWDEDEGDYQTNYSAPRSYVTAISEILETPAEDCVGHAKNDVGEARMDSKWRLLRGGLLRKMRTRK